MSSSIWNLKHPLRTGHIQLAGGGKELFGTVIRDRRMKKTCTVWVSRFRYNQKYGKWTQNGKKFHCYDEEEYCRTGDKVIIRQCRKINPLVYYYVRNIVLPIGRHNLYEKDLSQYEKDAIKYNEQLRERNQIKYF